MHTDGDRVEYFSTSHQRWLSGFVHLQHAKDRACYSVVLNKAFSKTAQERPDVRPELLRRPFKDGERVWALNEGCCLQAEIKGAQAALPTISGYRVLLPDGNSVSLEAGALERRFEPGLSVYIFDRDAWRAGVVQGHSVPEFLEFLQPSRASAIDATAVNTSLTGVSRHLEWKRYAKVEIFDSHENRWVHSAYLRAARGIAAGQILAAEEPATMVISTWPLDCGDELMDLKIRAPEAVDRHHRYFAPQTAYAESSLAGSSRSCESRMPEFEVNV